MQVYGLVGNPVDHLLSPPMHEATYEETGLGARYVTFESARDDIATAVEDADALGVSGLNVTIPFKQDVPELVDPDPLAERIDAVNTVDFGGETPKGYNTNAAGVTRSFERHGVDLTGNSTIVIGADGAGRTAVFVPADASASVHIANQTVETVVELATAVPGATDGRLDTLGRIREADAFVDMTSVGMESPDETPISVEYLHGDLAVLGAVYTPLEMRPFRGAAAAGTVTINSAWMLLLQGVETFERWTERDAPVSAMNAVLRSHLEND